jgi:hypothetical protein
MQGIELLPELGGFHERSPDVVDDWWRGGGFPYDTPRAAGPASAADSGEYGG